MLKEFWIENNALIQITGIASAIGALFLNVDSPENEMAKSALANIQVFCLLVMVVCLSLLFVVFVKLVVKKEKQLRLKYDAPIVGTFSIIVSPIFLWVIVNFIQYILNFDSKYSSYFLDMILASAVIVSVYFAMLWLEKNEEKLSLFTRVIVISFVASLSISLIGLVIQGLILKYVYFYWGILVLPVSFVLIFTTLLVILIIEKKALFSLARARNNSNSNLPEK